MGEECSAHGGDAYTFWYENVKDHSEAVGVDRRIILIDLMESGRESVDWIHLARDRNWWRTLVITLINFRVP
jgi:hypothetical protein